MRPTAVETAAREVIAEGTTVTYDLGGTAGTREFARDGGDPGLAIESRGR